MQTISTKPATIPVEIYEELFNYLNEVLFETCYFEDDSDVIKEFEFESEDGRWFITGEAVATSEYVDESFDHAFGTEHCGYWAMDRLDSITVHDVTHYDEDDNETCVPFDYEIFEHLHDVATIHRGGVTITKGDDVIVKLSGYGRGPLGNSIAYDRWLPGKFIAYDTYNQVYHWEDAQGCRRTASKIWPATVENRNKVGIN